MSKLLPYDLQSLQLLLVIFFSWIDIEMTISPVVSFIPLLGVKMKKMLRQTWRAKPENTPRMSSPARTHTHFTPGSGDTSVPAKTLWCRLHTLPPLSRQSRNVPNLPCSSFESFSLFFFFFWLIRCFLRFVFFHWNCQQQTWRVCFIPWNENKPELITGCERKLSAIENLNSDTLAASRWLQLLFCRSGGF